MTCGLTMAALYMKYILTTAALEIGTLTVQGVGAGVHLASARGSIPKLSSHSFCALETYALQHASGVRVCVCVCLCLCMCMCVCTRVCVWVRGWCVCLQWYITRNFQHRNNSPGMHRRYSLTDVQMLPASSALDLTGMRQVTHDSAFTSRPVTKKTSSDKYITQLSAAGTRTCNYSQACYYSRHQLRRYVI